MLKSNEELVYRAIEQLTKCYFDLGGKKWIANYIKNVRSISDTEYLKSLNIKPKPIYFNISENKFTLKYKIDDSILTQFDLNSQISDLDFILDNTIEDITKYARNTKEIEYTIFHNKPVIPIKYIDYDSYYKSPLELIEINTQSSLYNFNDIKIGYDELLEFNKEIYKAILPKIYEDEDKFVREYTSTKLNGYSKLLFVSNTKSENYNICLDYFKNNYDVDSELNYMLLILYCYQNNNIDNYKLIYLLSLSEKEITFTNIFSILSSNFISNKANFVIKLFDLMDLLNIKFNIDVYENDVYIDPYRGSDLLKTVFNKYHINYHSNFKDIKSFRIFNKVYNHNNVSFNKKDFVDLLKNIIDFLTKNPGDLDWKFNHLIDDFDINDCDDLTEYLNNLLEDLSKKNLFKCNLSYEYETVSTLYLECYILNFNYLN